MQSHPKAPQHVPFRPLTPVEKAEVLARTMGGEYQIDICQQMGITKRQIGHALCTDAEFVAQMQVIRTALIHDAIDSAHYIAEHEVDVARAKLRVDLLRWHASKLMPKTYGERLDISVENTIRIQDAINAGRERAGLTTRVIDVAAATGSEPVALSPLAAALRAVEGDATPPENASPVASDAPATRRGMPPATPGALVRSGALQPVLTQNAGLTRASAECNPFDDVDDENDPFSP